MGTNSSDLMKSYNSLADLSLEVMNLLVIKYSGVPQYDIGRYFQDKIGPKTTQKEYQNVVKDLI
ncbi:MAG TPA: hypothetical protein DCL77_17285, partial [Prolixibacteraceae bacterium]|nr:hypothetical protein [Prolixibacteraceae bacterium]